MNRRSFISGLVATTAGLYLPHEPQRIYSFASSKYMQVVNMTKRLIANGMLVQSSIDNQIQLAMGWDNASIEFMNKLAPNNYFMWPPVLWAPPVRGEVPLFIAATPSAEKLKIVRAWAAGYHDTIGPNAKS